MPSDDPSRPAGPFRLTGYAALHVLWVVPVILLFVLTVVGGLLVVVWVGMPMLMGLLPGVRAAAESHRRLAARTLGGPVPASYRPLAGDPLRDLRIRAADPATWRDLLWLVWAATGGLVLSLAVVVVFLAVATFPIWLYGVGPLMRIRATVDRAILSPDHVELLEQRVHTLTESRAVVVDHSAAELRRIERDLHDGPQARLAAISLNLGLAADLLGSDPEAARRLVESARSTSSSALAELREVVRGIHPPVLADRGLPGAVSALALDMAVPVDLALDVPDRLPAPVESAVYFTVAECLANVGKHAHASAATVRLRHDGERLCGEVSDDGGGGADPDRGEGLHGIAARLAAFDGTMSVSSPAGGPTVVRWEVPCASSSPRTMRSSAPG
ncbi:sensor domain-containing protein [Phycicoccus sp. CSK15P-2]|uniref:sensor histidine kinase n=1 Tax=Phycicoccus sp. CSK15P-2 TaxID=2807627 RepID=UPI001951E682|nr:sensor domain-containing protein [Phycicoccus sp. CSK15P-2]MBM6403571.1 sensor domain-containing protein [Phycicoccus sp. CSK15P-2]